MSKQLEEFRAYRRRMNEKILGCDHLGIKRFFNLDTKAYEDGALDGRTKELLGLVASTVLRCNDCIDYHLIQCVRLGFSDAELHDGLNVALVVGGSITIPHLRHAFDTIEQLRGMEGAGGTLDSTDEHKQPDRSDHSDLWLDVKAGHVWVDGTLLEPLTSSEFRLLTFLYEHRGEICDRRQIAEVVWGMEYPTEVDDSRIDKLVSRLRFKVEPYPQNPRYLVTVRGRGLLLKRQ